MCGHARTHARTHRHQSSQLGADKNAKHVKPRNIYSAKRFVLSELCTTHQEENYKDA